MTCEECKASREPLAVPYVVHESAMARAERKEKRMWVVIVLLILSLVGCFLYETQFETVTQEVTQEADTGANHFVGGDFYGEADSPNDFP